jgi:hypothetical protein
MSLVALLVLIITALTGLVILGAWLTRSDVRRARGAHGTHRRLPPTLVFGHIAMALIAATAWIVFVITKVHGVGLTGLVFILLAASLGITMFVRWVPTYRRSGELGVAPHVGPGAAHRAPSTRNLPLTVVLTHGVFAVTTLVLIIVALV